MQEFRDLIARLANRDIKRSEATVQADIRQLLLTAPLDLGDEDLRDVPLEAHVGEGRRIDIETGSTVIEVKRDLRKGKILQNAVAQLAGYVRVREAEMGRRFAGIVTDGAEWICHHLGPNGLAVVSVFEVHHERPEVEHLLVWLEGVLATKQHLQPRPSEIALRLGATSSAYALDRASLGMLYTLHKHTPSVKMKRQLWARLLTTAFGKQFEDKDDLFVEHTLLVATAEIIAHAVVDLALESIEPASLVSGEKFRESGIHGVLESDFFDWMIDVPGGDAFIRTHARRLARFDWTRVEHDVLKVLYESIITTETRKKLGEYYTPDWLAEQVVDAVVRKPLETRVLDPACGSGTFLFHAVRRHLEAADAAHMTTEAALAGLTSHVIGIDLHPVAVTLARVTYLLAIGRERLVGRRGDIQIPVFLGDSMQWRQERLELFTGGHLVIHTDEIEMFQSSLRFPGELIDDARRFDQLVERLADMASSRRPRSAVPSLQSVFAVLGIPSKMHATIVETFRTMCDLYDQGRDHIWGYFVRNLARPCGRPGRTTAWTHSWETLRGSRIGTC